MVGQSAVATVQAYAYDATSAELNNIQAQVGSGASITGFVRRPDRAAHSDGSAVPRARSGSLVLRASRPAGNGEVVLFGLPGSARLLNRSDRSQRTVGRMGWRDLRTRRDYRSKTRTRPSSQT
jgi:hypothetical protein